MSKRFNSMKKLALHWKIIIGMILGIIIGFVAVIIDNRTGSESNTVKRIVIYYVKPFGTIFINGLKLIAVPLIVASLVKAISDMKDISKLSKLGGRTLITYIATTVVAVIIGMVLVNLIKPGEFIPLEIRESLSLQYQEAAQGKIEVALSQKETGPLQALIDLVPSNIFEAASENKNMLQVIFFAILFGIGIILSAPEKTKTVKDFFDNLNEVVLKIIDLIMIYSPLGVFALMASLVAENPDPGIFAGLGMYSLTLLLGLAIMIFGVYPLLVYLFTGKKYGFFFSGIGPAQLVAFTTSSSAATLPVTMERVEEHLGVKKEAASFILPIGATVNMDGTSCYQAVAAIFIAQAFDIDLSIGAQLGIILTATLASIGAAAVPSAGIIMLVIVLGQAGIPEAGIALIFAVDRPLDMCRTVVNVTGDAAVSMIVAKSTGQLGDPKVKDWDDHYNKENSATN
jgi:proton glutamate symport protein